MSRSPTRGVRLATALLLLTITGCGGRVAEDAAPTTDSGVTDSGPVFMFDAGPPLGEGADPSIPAAAGEARAGRVDAVNTDVLLSADPAGGEAGDWILYNSCARFVVQDVRVGDGYTRSPGALIDADLIHPAGVADTDLIWELVTLLNTRVFEAEEVGVLSDGSDGGPAIVRAIGRDEPLGLIVAATSLGSQTENLRVIQDYILQPDSCSLEIRTTVVADGSHSAEIGMGDFVIFGKEEGLPFGDGNGFADKGLLATHDWLGMAGHRNRQTVLIFAEAGRNLDNPLGDILSDIAGGGLFLYQVIRPMLGLYEYVSFSRYVALAPDLAGARAEMHAVRGTPDLGTVSGTVTEPGGAPVAGVRVHLARVEGGGSRFYESFAVSLPDGTFTTDVPAGDYEVVAIAEGLPFHVSHPSPPTLPFPFADGREPAAAIMASVSAGAVTTVDPVVGETGSLDLTITDGSGGPSAAKVSLTLVGPDPTPPVEMLGEASYGSGAKKTLWTVNGSINASVAPGTYDLVASHGPESEVDVRAGVVVPPGGVLTLIDLVVPDVVDSSGYLSLDTHVHAGASPDGEVTYDDRVGTIMGAGLDMFVSTDHDFVWDYTPSLMAMGVIDQLGFVLSEEVSHVVLGHFNAYPATPLSPSGPSGGAVRWSDNSWTTDELFTAIRSELQPGILQVNHGRSGMFEAAGYDPVTGVVGMASRWSDDFDAMEILNGKRWGEVEPLILDWFSLLNQGRRIVGTGSSDDHKYGHVGWGRTYVALAEPDPVMVLPEELADGIRSMDVIISGGPFLRVDIDGAPPGSDVDGSAGTVTLNVQVLAPSWMTVNDLTVYANGIAIMTVPASAPAPPVWMNESLVLTPAVDTWYVVRVDGGDLAPVLPARTLFALSNPIFVDSDGGGFDPPGL